LINGLEKGCEDKLAGCDILAGMKGELVKKRLMGEGD